LDLGNTMSLDRSKFSFSFSQNLESLLFYYLKKHPQNEIFIGLLGTIEGKRNTILYEINDLIPFPNLSEEASIIVTPPIEWMAILEERRKLLNNNFKFLGFIHSHPGKSSKKSRLDDEFSLQLLRQYGSFLMIIIGYNYTLRCYLVDQDKTNLISGRIELFKIKIK
jgi:proteasome lid subunit RPN8/RPN11